MMFLFDNLKSIFIVGLFLVATAFAVETDQVGPDDLQGMFTAQFEQDVASLSQVEIDSRLDNFKDFKALLKNKLIPRYGSEIVYSFFIHEGSPGNLLHMMTAGKVAITQDNALQLVYMIEDQAAIPLSQKYREAFLQLMPKIICDCNVLQELSEFDIQIQSLSSPKPQRQLYYELYRMLTYYNEIDSLHNATFFNQKIELAKMAFNVMDLEEKYNDLTYLRGDLHTACRFYFNQCDHEWLAMSPGRKWPDSYNAREITEPPVPFAVVKHHGGAWLETPAYEIMSIFGVSSAFMPTMSVDVGVPPKASVQPFWNPPLLFSWPTNIKTPDGSIARYSSIANNMDFKSFVHCSLGALLLSLWDQSLENTLIKQLVNGQYAIINFDNGGCLSRVNGFGVIRGADGNVFKLHRSFWAWYYDLPHANRSLKKYEEVFVRDLIQGWVGKFQDFLMYMNHPLTDFFASDMDEAIGALKERLDIMSDYVGQNEQFSLVEILFAVLPDYEPLILKLKALGFQAGDAPFTIMFPPWKPLGDISSLWRKHFGIPTQNVGDFFEWYYNFAEEIDERSRLPDA